MSRCLITYDDLESRRYSTRGLRLLDRNLKDLADVPYSAEEQRQEAIRRSDKMSIQGVQPKLSARLNVKEGRFDIVDTGGRFILKPQSHLYRQLPENEDLTMKCAAATGITVPLTGLLHSSDGSLTYFIRRFDRQGRRKIALEDFAQLTGKTRETKYDSSMEHVVDVIDRFATFPLLEKIKLFRLTVFNFLIGNEDMHLKNFSLMSHNGKTELSPAYDLINTTIVIGGDAEEIALPLKGKKKGITANVLTEYYAVERMELPARIIDNTLRDFSRAIPQWFRLLEKSFLSDKIKQQYAELVNTRRKTMTL